MEINRNSIIEWLIQRNINLNDIDRRDIIYRLLSLSDRELEYINLICKGMSNGQIAKELGVKLGTAKTTSSIVVAKVGLGTRYSFLYQINRRFM